MMHLSGESPKEAQRTAPTNEARVNDRGVVIDALLTSKSGHSGVKLLQLFVIDVVISRVQCAVNEASQMLSKTSQWRRDTKIYTLTQGGLLHGENCRHTLALLRLACTPSLLALRGPIRLRTRC
ncbi:hypothetical protein PINS_up002371 [Pythium insidiosum]|nr:hypothetical protein PINS_up002371 [Pythium insidiosum]